MSAEEKLTQIEKALVKKIEKETNGIQFEEDVQVRKEKRRELSPVNKILKIVREDLGPQLVKYQVQ